MPSTFGLSYGGASPSSGAFSATAAPPATGVPYAPYSSTPYSAVATPAPTTWQDQEEQNARNLWNSQAPDVYGAESSALAGQNYAVGQSGAALARLQSFAPTNLQGYQPTALAGYNPNAALTGPSGSASKLALSYTGAGGGGGIVDNAQGDGFADAKKAATDAMNFDPSAYGTTFAEGAESEFNTDLNTQLSQLERNAAGTGRLETGFYTGDQGKVATNLGNDFNSKIAQAATTFSGQKLSALQGGASALTSIDSAMASAKQAATNELDYTRLTSDQAAISAQLAEEGMSVAEQQQAASLGLTQAQMLSQLQLTKATSIDQMGLTQSSEGLQGALQEEQMARSGYQSAASAAGAYTSATRDWAAQDKSTQDQIDFETALMKYLQGQGGKPTGPGGPTLPAGPTSGGSGPANTDPYAFFRQQAAALGTTFTPPTGG